MNETDIGVINDDYTVNSFEEFAADIAAVLELGYHLTADQAEEAVRIMDLRPIFESDPEMALHTSYEGWAEDVLAYWRKHQS